VLQEDAFPDALADADRLEAFDDLLFIHVAGVPAGTNRGALIV
jgi:hypothetical protein